MEHIEIFKKLTRIISQVLGNDDLTLKPETTAEDVEGWDSFNHINIIVGAELEFGIRFNASELETLRNVGDFVTLIEKRTSAKK